MRLRLPRSPLLGRAHRASDRISLGRLFLWNRAARRSPASRDYRSTLDRSDALAVGLAPVGWLALRAALAPAWPQRFAPSKPGLALAATERGTANPDRPVSDLGCGGPDGMVTCGERVFGTGGDAGQGASLRDRAALPR